MSSESTEGGSPSSPYGRSSRTSEATTGEGQCCSTSSQTGAGSGRSTRPAGRLSRTAERSEATDRLDREELLEGKADERHD